MTWPAVPGAPRPLPCFSVPISVLSSFLLPIHPIASLSRALFLRIFEITPSFEGAWGDESHLISLYAAAFATPCRIYGLVPHFKLRAPGLRRGDQVCERSPLGQSLRGTARPAARSRLRTPPEAAPSRSGCPQCAARRRGGDEANFDFLAGRLTPVPNPSSASPATAAQQPMSRGLSR